LWAYLSFLKDKRPKSMVYKIFIVFCYIVAIYIHIIAPEPANFGNLLVLFIFTPVFGTIIFAIGLLLLAAINSIFKRFLALLPGKHKEL